ncbi:MAG: transporter substrate-binding domain-containing protein [Cellvibrionaceae bacterium]|nr:transporter substrate-binding domain-containing protein [Cellvibrionaceae bacterium]
MRIKTLIFLLLSLGFSKLSFSIEMANIPFATSNSTRISAVKLTGLHQEDQGGDYDKIYKSVSGVTSTKFDITPLPSKAALQRFKSGEFDCISPINTNPNFYQFSFPTAVSKDLFEARVYLFTASGSNPISDLELLDGKKLGVRKGVTYGNKIDNLNIVKIKSDSITQNIRNLENGTIDAFVAYWPEVYTTFNDLKMEKLPHNISKPIATHKDQLVCHKTPANIRSIKELNRKIEALRNNKKL